MRERDNWGDPDVDGRISSGSGREWRLDGVGSG